MNAGDVQAQVEPKRDEEVARLQQEDDWRAQLSTPHGRRVVWHLLGRTGCWGPSFNTDAALMAYVEGRRSVGLELMAYLQTHHRAAYVQMHREANERVVG
jgi:hypothetical protein